jgi:SpoVK/Ycf46/Vps4 family AAA+-type ATPase
MRLDALFSRYFGETAGKLRLLFDQMASQRAVYLLDEFDALGARRGNTNDIGEARRVLNSVLAFMEQPNATDSLVVAATNHSEILDKALARRFDEVIAYDVPDAEAARLLVQRRLGRLKLASRDWIGLAELTRGLSQGELVRAADAVVKAAILAGQDKATAGDLKAALEDRQAFRRTFGGDQVQ